MESVLCMYIHTTCSPWWKSRDASYARTKGDEFSTDIFFSLFVGLAGWLAGG